MKSSHVKILQFLVIVVAVIVSVIIVDKVDFVARWLGHLLPYKNNIERVFYFCVLLPVLLKYAWRLREFIKGLKLKAGGFGFEIEFKDDDGDTDKPIRVETHSSSANVRYKLRNKSQEIARKILSRLQAEMHVEFSENAILKRGECCYRPDGFAVKNGQAYIVEIKTSDYSYVVDNAVNQLKTFSNMLPDKKLMSVTAILCMVSNHPVSYFKKRIEATCSALDINFILRVFTPEEVN